MKVKMITALTTEKLCLSFGEVVELEKTFAKKLIEANMAVLVEEEVVAPKVEKVVEETLIEEAPVVKRGRKKKVVK